MIRKFILLFFIGSTLLVYGQKPVLSSDFDFTIGEKYKRIKNFRSYYMAFGNRFLSLKKGRNDMTIQRFSLKENKEEVKKRQVIKDKGDFQSFIDLEGSALVLYTIKNKAYAQKLSLTGIIAEKPIQLVSDGESINNDFGFSSTYGYDAGGRINKFVFKKSFDGKKLLVLYRVKTAAGKPDKIGISVFDSDLQLLWKRKLRLPHASERMQNDDFGIDSEGHFYMTASIFDTGNSDKDKLASPYRTEVYKITENSEEIIKSKIYISGKAIADAVLGQDKKGNVTVSGFYSNANDTSTASGIFTTTLNEEGQVTKVNAANFPTTTVQQYQVERVTRIEEGTQSEDDKQDFENLRVNDVVFTADGSMVLLAEQRYVTTHTTSSSSGSMTTYKYYYRDVVSAKLAPEGTVIWFHKLPKYQMGVRGKGSMSYRSFKRNDKHYLFYIDHFTNLKRSLSESPAKYYDGKKEFLYLTSYVIDDFTGEVTKEPILTSSDVRNSRLDQMKISQTTILPTGRMIVEAYDGKKNNLLVNIEAK